MKKYIQSIVYVVSLLGAWYVMKLLAASEENPFSIYENPMMWVIFIGTMLIIFMKEILTLVALTKSNVVKEEKETPKGQNDKLPWWLFLSYGVILMGAIYFVSSPMKNVRKTNQESTLEANNGAPVEVKKKVDATTAQLLTDTESLKKGKAIFTMYCASCHANDGGGGIGPNLTDEYWIIGGNMENVFRTIQEGGRPGKGMLPWKRSIKAENIEKLASYVLSLQGKSTKNPKDPQGEFWEE